MVESKRRGATALTGSLPPQKSNHCSDGDVPRHEVTLARRTARLTIMTPCAAYRPAGWHLASIPACCRSRVRPAARVWLTIQIALSYIDIEHGPTLGTRGLATSQFDAVRAPGQSGCLG